MAQFCARGGGLIVSCRDTYRSFLTGWMHVVCRRGTERAILNLTLTHRETLPWLRHLLQFPLKGAPKEARNEGTWIS